MLLVRAVWMVQKMIAPAVWVPPAPQSMTSYHSPWSARDTNPDLQNIGRRITPTQKGLSDTRIAHPFRVQHVQKCSMSCAQPLGNLYSSWACTRMWHP